MTSEFAVRTGAILMAILAAILARAAIGRESFWCVVAMLGAGMVAAAEPLSWGRAYGAVFLVGGVLEFLDARLPK